MRDEGGIALSRFYSFVEGIAEIRRAGRDVLLVTSGAVGLGVQRLGLPGKPRELPLKQACAAIGQGRLMSIYADAFDKLGVTTAQVLLTEDDFSNRRRYLNLRSTIMELLRLGVLPIINENDTVSTAELETSEVGGHRKVNFGDNDKLSALVASKVDADLLIILTDVEGLFTGDPRSDSSASLIPIVDHITKEIESLAGAGGTAQPSGKSLGRGGMRTKLEAAGIASQSGCATVIAGGKIPGVIPRLFSGEEIGTLFLPKPGMAGKLRWIAFATTVNAALVVNSGAFDALVKRKASLLPAGVVKVSGSFKRGDVVSVLDESEREFARGIVNYASDEIAKIVGLHSDAIDTLIPSRNYDAIITRDNMAIWEKQP